MEIIRQIAENHMLLCAGAAYILAQIVKVIIELIFNKEFSGIGRLFTGNGGMPSSHSATVCALATTAGIECGLSSPVFALCMIFAIVVMTDASGVRRETGTQAVIINQMMEHLKEMARDGLKQTPEFYQEKLKELIGHTPTQVRVGAGLGIIIAVAMHFIFWI